MAEERIVFGKPNPELLNKLGFSCADMHFHSRYSDTFTKIKNVVKKAKKKGIGFAITDHNEVKGAVEACKLGNGLLIVPGMEVSTKEGAHLLTYFYNINELEEFYKKEIKHHKSGNPYMATKVELAHLIDSTKNYNCIVCAAHPFAPGIANLYKKYERGDVDLKLIKRISVMEAINGYNLRNRNEKAVEWIAEMQKGFTGGSDGHTLSQLGGVLTFSKENNLDSFLDSIVKKKNFVIGKEIKLSRMISHSKQIKHLKYLGPAIRINYEIGAKRHIDKILNGIQSIKIK